jgi:pimeloyl-ACP methyl ester carboxylesterase
VAGSAPLQHGPVAASQVGEGPDLVLIHGLAGSGDWWTHNQAALTAAFRVTTIDLPGFGTSHPEARLILDEVPGQVAALMRDQGIGRAHLMGHSMGGLVAGALAADYPDRIDRLVLVDAGFLAFDPKLRHRVTGLFRTLPWTSPSLMPVLLRDMLRSGPIRMMAATGELLRKDWREKLPAISAPTLVIWGEHDRVCSPSIGREIAATVPNARLVVIAGAGHSPMWEKPADFDREVLAFLGGTSGQPGQSALPGPQPTLPPVV